jgi:hypothetical protein
MAHTSMNKDERLSAPENPKANPNRRRLAIRDRALLLVYCLMAVVAMGGWLWFLGRLSWNILTWAVRGLA